MNIIKNKARITVVDALRGFALVSIMLLHNIEMFEVYAAHPSLPEWLISIDSIIWDTFFFLFGGKSYAIFALLFGLTFYIQTHNQEEKGQDFRLRFIWRMLLLIGFGIFNTLFYRGEILVLYAVLALFLIPFNKLNNKALLISALILLLQPILLCKLIVAIGNPTLEPAVASFMPFYINSGEFLTGDSMFQLMKSNITDGRIASLLWFWEYGRIEQTFGLFLLGFLAGRKRIFYNTPENIKFWIKTLVVSTILFIPLYILKSNPEVFSDSKNITKSIGAIITLWSNLAFMLVLASGFILLFYNDKTQPLLSKLSPIGKMSLSNYILQSIVGASIYYGFGLGIYQYVGATYCLLIGIVLVIAMGLFSSYWMKKHKRGILENIWHKLTWIGTSKQ
ncbi:MAG: DUF418 domain-containing protein [Colwellia sp.]